jgi:hypothetical protein
VFIEDEGQTRGNEEAPGVPGAVAFLEKSFSGHRHLIPLNSFASATG